MSHILYNPKATAPAVYIPAWLSQVPSICLTASCKMVYGRLAQWATSQGKAHRSASQLSQELGIPIRTIEDSIRTLKNKLLIGSCQIDSGKVNHYEFYDHPWMNEPINKYLCYKSDNFTPSAKSVVPSAKSVVPSAKSVVHKIKEIKEIKCVGAVASQHIISSFPSKKEIYAKKAFDNEDLKAFFDIKFVGLTITYEQLFNECKEHYDLKNQWVNLKKWKTWLEREMLDNYSKIGLKSKKAPLSETDEERRKRQTLDYELEKENGKCFKCE